MKEINISETLNQFLANTTAEQLLAEIESPEGLVLMAIPDEHFFYIPEKKLDIAPACVNDWLAEAITFYASSVSWTMPASSLRPSAKANQELALAA